MCVCFQRLFSGSASLASLVNISLLNWSQHACSKQSRQEPCQYNAKMHCIFPCMKIYVGHCLRFVPATYVNDGTRHIQGGYPSVSVPIMHALSWDKETRDSGAQLRACVAYLLILSLFAGWGWCWFGLAGADFFERKILLAGWFGLAETNKRTSWLPYSLTLKFGLYWCLC